MDAQLASTREWSLRDVALAFGVPAYMLGVPGDSSTYANVESRMIELRTFTLLPWQRRIESTLDAQLPKGTSLKVRSDGLLRADTSTRYSAYSAALDRRVADRRRGTRAGGPPTAAERRGVVMTDQLAMEIRSVDTSERMLVGVVAPYDQTTYLVADPGGERITRGAFAKIDPPAGRQGPAARQPRAPSARMGISKSFEDGDDGLVGTFLIYEGDKGDSLLEDLRHGYLGGMSVGFQPLVADPGRRRRPGDPGGQAGRGVRRGSSRPMRAPASWRFVAPNWYKRTCWHRSATRRW